MECIRKPKPIINRKKKKKDLLENNKYMNIEKKITRSIPIVSWIPVSNASFSLVPTPSVPATRYESPVHKI